jgi:hypothetical protein
MASMICGERKPSGRLSVGRPLVARLSSVLEPVFERIEVSPRRHAVNWALRVASACPLDGDLRFSPPRVGEDCRIYSHKSKRVTRGASSAASGRDEANLVGYPDRNFGELGAKPRDDGTC